MDAIHSGVAWFDDRGEPVSAHGAGILKEGDRYYIFGEYKTDGSNVFNGISCYSSSDLVNWKFERIVLPVQNDGRLGPNRVGERPKVMKCPATGEFVMFMHTDGLDYRDPAVGYATCDKVSGQYEFQGPLEHDGRSIQKWDIGVFQDEDGSGYLITHSGNLFQLSDDYKSVAAPVIEGMTAACESPVIFKRQGVYYWLGSGLTGWERNDNEYFTSNDLEGPWEKQGHFAPVGSLTWNSQSTYVLPIAGSETTTFMFMGDRWAHPRQRSAATYVWQPIEFDRQGRISLPRFLQSWQLDLRSGASSASELDGEFTPISELERAKFSGGWRPFTDESGYSDIRSDVKGASLTIAFHGTQCGLYGVARPDGGFAEVQLADSNGNEVLSSVIETYCKYNESSLKFLSPRLERGDYVLTVTVLGEHFYWKAKKGTYGSAGDYVSIEKVLVAD